MFVSVHKKKLNKISHHKLCNQNAAQDIKSPNIKSPKFYSSFLMSYIFRKANMQQFVLYCFLQTHKYTYSVFRSTVQYSTITSKIVIVVTRKTSNKFPSTYVGFTRLNDNTSVAVLLEYHVFTEFTYAHPRMVSTKLLLSSFIVAKWI